MIYVASPYSHPDSRVRAARYKGVLPVLAQLARAKISSYSPIVHWHNVQVQEGIREEMFTFDLWRWSDIDMMNLSTEGLFLKIDGWDLSAGMSHEGKHFRLSGKKTTWIFPHELPDWIEARCTPKPSSPL